MNAKPVCIIDWDGVETWVLDGKYHREDGPAIKLPSGYKAWYFNGGWHRTDGPAREWANGETEWWLNNKCQYPEIAIHDPKLQAKYPKLIESMMIYLVHSS